MAGPPVPTALVPAVSCCWRGASCPQLLLGAGPGSSSSPVPQLFTLAPLPLSPPCRTPAGEPAQEPVPSAEPRVLPKTSTLRGPAPRRARCSWLDGQSGRLLGALGRAGPNGMRKQPVFASHQGPRGPTTSRVAVRLGHLWCWSTPLPTREGCTPDPSYSPQVQAGPLVALPPVSVPALGCEQLSCHSAVSSQAGPPTLSLAPPGLASVCNV